VLGTPLRTSGVWAPCMGVGRPHSIRGAWVALRVSYARATLWIMVLDPRFLGLRILNIIICFKNIIIFIIINLINKIINNFERKYYY
jgi:septum formation inhibitor-activating ATPase MinD